MCRSTFLWTNKDMSRKSKDVGEIIIPDIGTNLLSKGYRTVMRPCMYMLIAKNSDHI